MKYLAILMLLLVPSLVFACDGKPCGGEMLGEPCDQAGPTPALVTVDDVVNTYKHFAGQAASKAGAALQACNEGAMRAMMNAQRNDRRDVGIEIQELYPEFQKAEIAFARADARVRLAIYDAENTQDDAVALRAAASIADALHGFKDAGDKAAAVLSKLAELHNKASLPKPKDQKEA
jgi:hypothetical protein